MLRVHTLTVCVVYVRMWINASVSVCGLVRKYESVCLSLYVRRFHDYLLFDPCCEARRSSVPVLTYQCFCVCKDPMPRSNVLVLVLQVCYMLCVLCQVCSYVDLSSGTSMSGLLWR